MALGSMTAAVNLVEIAANFLGGGSSTMEKVSQQLCFD